MLLLYVLNFLRIFRVTRLTDILSMEKNIVDTLCFAVAQHSRIMALSASTDMNTKKDPQDIQCFWEDYVIYPRDSIRYKAEVLSWFQNVMWDDRLIFEDAVDWNDIITTLCLYPLLQFMLNEAQSFHYYCLE